MATKKQEETRGKTITFEDARIIFRNFEGKEDRFNPKGRRNFCVLLDEETAHILKKDGWNVRWLPPRDEGDEEQAYMQVSVSYKTRPPKIVLISESTRGKTYVDEASVHILDWADIRMVDFIVSPYHWDINGKTGVKAYLKKMFVTLVEDELERKYADIPQENRYEEDFDDDGLD